MLTRRQIHSLGVVTTLLASVSCSDDATVSTDPPMEPELEWTTHVIHDYEFAGLQYFFLRDPEGCPWEIDEASLQLFVDNQNPGDDPYRGAIEATATPDGEPPVPEEDDAHAGRYHPLFYGSEFMIQTHIYVGQPVLILTRPLDPDDYLAAVFRGWELEWSGTEWIRGERIEIGIYGDPKTAPTLKMIRASDDDRRVDETDLRAGTWGNTSRLELRNVYDLSARNLRGLELSIHIKRTIGSEVAPDDLDDGTTFLSLTALDLSRRTEQGTVPGFDNQVDEEFLDLRRGRLIFPDLHPFDPDSSDLCIVPRLTCNDRSYCRFDPDSNPTKAGRPRTGGDHTWMVLDPFKFRAPGLYRSSRRVLESEGETYSLYEIRARTAR